MKKWTDLQSRKLFHLMHTSFLKVISYPVSSSSIDCWLWLIGLYYVPCTAAEGYPSSVWLTSASGTFQNRWRLCIIGAPYGASGFSARLKKSSRSFTNEFTSWDASFSKSRLTCKVWGLFFPFKSKFFLGKHISTSVSVCAHEAACQWGSSAQLLGEYVLHVVKYVRGSDQFPG